MSRTPTRNSSVDVLPDGKLKVLLVEDDVLNCQTMTWLLERAGHCVTAALSRTEALESVATKPFDVVLMDLRLPESDGPASVRAVHGRCCALKKHPPIVALTGRSCFEMFDELLDAGVVRCLQKPIDPDTLFDALKEVSCGFDVPFIQRADLFEHTADDADLLLELIPMFREVVAQNIGVLRSGLLHGEAPRLLEAIRDLKSTFALFGAHPAERNARRLETLISKAAPTHALTSALFALEHCVMCTRLELEALVHDSAANVAAASA